MRTYEATQGSHYDITRNSFFILFPAKCIVSNREIIFSLLYVRLKGTCGLDS